MVYYILGIVFATLIVAYIVAYWIKKVIVKKAKFLFQISSIGDIQIDQKKINEMGISSEYIKDKYEALNVKTLAFAHLDKMLVETRKIKNIFNFKKYFIYGNGFIYKKYRSILGNIKIAKLEEQISELKEKQNLLHITHVMQGFGLHDLERNKILAGLITKEKHTTKKEESTQKPTLDLDDLIKSPSSFAGTSVLDLDKNIIKKLSGELRGNKEKNKKDIQKINQKIKEFNVNTDEDDEEDINEVLEEKGIKIED